MQNPLKKDGGRDYDEGKKVMGALKDWWGREVMTGPKFRKKKMDAEVLESESKEEENYFKVYQV